MRRFTLFFAGLAALLGASCIENDIPYPDAAVSIESVTGEGFTVRQIDVTTRTVFLTLDERTDIRRVRIDEVRLGVTSRDAKLTEEELLAAVRVSRPLTGEFDLRAPIYVTLSLYADYDWTICAEQQIDRSFRVGRQVGPEEIDPETRTATAYVAKGTDLGSIEVKQLRLGPDGVTTYSPTAAELSGTSFETVRFVDVTCHGRTERWLLYVRETDKSVELTGAYPGSRVVWLFATGVAGETMGFRCRRAGEEEWLPVEDVAVDGGSFSARMPAEAETSYEVMAFCGADESEPVSVTTGIERQLPNNGFEQWCTVKDIVYPYAAGDDPFWGTGNMGAALGNKTLTNEGEPRPGSEGRCGADLQSQFVGLGGTIGKFAAGNLFVGEYIRNAVTNGVLTFGRSFVQRPTRLRFWAKFQQGPITRLKSKPAGSDIKLGDPDIGHVYIALGTWGATPEKVARYGKDADGTQVGTADSPICIDTRSVATFFDANGEDVIAYGEKVFDAPVDGWTEFTIELDYRRYDVAPTNIMVVCTASRWGDYFTGSESNRLWLDDFVLEYD